MQIPSFQIAQLMPWALDSPNCSLEADGSWLCRLFLRGPCWETLPPPRLAAYKGISQFRHC